MIIGDPTKVDYSFRQIQKRMLLKDTGGLQEGETQSFLGRLITNCGNYMELKLSEGYIESILKEANMVNCSLTTTPGTSTNKHAFEDSEPLSTEQHRAHQRVVGKHGKDVYQTGHLLLEQGAG